jgi:hypothetical protein
LVSGSTYNGISRESNVGYIIYEGYFKNNKFDGYGRFMNVPE